MIKISFLMTVYNAEDHLNKVIFSILSQSHKNLELIIVNDGSKDNSVNIIKEFIEKDNRIKFINREINKGRAYSLNEALSYCTTEFIFINDSDDISSLDRVKKTLNYYNSLHNKERVGLIGGSGMLTNILTNEKTNLYFKKGIFLGKSNGEVHKYKLYCINPFIHSSIMYKKNALEKIGGFPKEVTSSIDYFTIVKVSKYFQIHGIEDRIVDRLITGKNYFMTSIMTKKNKENMNIIRSWIKKEIYLGKAYNYLSNIIDKVKG